MNLHLAVLAAYSLLLVAVGLWLGRRTRGTADFFVAGRRLPAGLIFATMLAANIGAGSTVGATGLAYRDGLSAWWWNGSAGIGSALLALWIAPRIWRQANEHQFLTTGDFLEHHYGWRVRGVVTALLWVASLCILAGQLIGIAWILHVVAGLPKYAGCLAGGLLMTTYFTAGGLRGSAWINLLQLGVKLFGFLVALPMVVARAGGWQALIQPPGTDAAYATFWHGGNSAALLVLLVPAFISSPGLLQKAYGGASEQAVRRGIGWNALALMAFGLVPAIMGMAARLYHPGLAQELALPTLLARDVSPLVGSVLLAAIFSAELSASDAVLFMLSTSLSQDLYRRFIRPQAGDAQVLSVARWAAAAGGALGIGLAVLLPSIIGALSIFYALLGASLFVPVVVGVSANNPRAHRKAVAASVGVGMAGAAFAHFAIGAAAGGLWTPATAGLSGACLGYAVARAWGRIGFRRRKGGIAAGG